MNFLFKRQRADGKVMHEWSQAAELVDWASLPYEWASSDATSLALMEMSDYLNVSGDLPSFRVIGPTCCRLGTLRPRMTPTGDGIYENTEGSGWVESWPPGMPHQEIYLAAMDQQASTAFARLATATGHADLAAAASARAAHIKAQIESEYYLPAQQSYAFSRNANGTTDNSVTIFPAVAWWDGDFSLANAGPLLTRWASSEFSTDWGTRDLSRRPRSTIPSAITRVPSGRCTPVGRPWPSTAPAAALRLCAT